jgi:hypothetical protein
VLEAWSPKDRQVFTGLLTRFNLELEASTARRAAAD